MCGPPPRSASPGSSALTSSEFRGSVATPAIEGNRVPQVPAWSLAAGVVWADPRLATLNLQVRATDMAWDDDLNTLELRQYGVVDVFAGRTVWRALQVFAAVENIFDSDYDVARTPVQSNRLAPHGAGGPARVLPVEQTGGGPRPARGARRRPLRRHLRLLRAFGPLHRHARPAPPTSGSGRRRRRPAPPCWPATAPAAKPRGAWCSSRTVRSTCARRRPCASPGG